MSPRMGPVGLMGRGWCKLTCMPILQRRAASSYANARIENEDDYQRQPPAANQQPIQCMRERKLNPMMSMITGKIGERGDQMCIVSITIWPMMNIAR